MVLGVNPWRRPPGYMQQATSHGKNNAPYKVIKQAERSLFPRSFIRKAVVKRRDLVSNRSNRKP